MDGIDGTQAAVGEQVLQFLGLFYILRGERTEGTMKMSPKGFAFKSKSTGQFRRRTGRGSRVPVVSA